MDATWRLGSRTGVSAWRWAFALAVVLRLLIGSPAVAQPLASDADWRYRIVQGDTLIALAEAWLEAPHGWRDLQKLNHVPDPLRLKPGSELRMPIAWLRRNAAVAEVQFTKGQVVLSRPGQADAALEVGATLRSGDSLRSGTQSSASLRFADGSRLLLPPDSEVTLDALMSLGRAALPAVRLRIKTGGADSRVTPNAQRVPLYEVTTPHVNLGVRGTEFRVQVGADGASRLQVLSGAVAADGAGAPVAAGEGLLAREGVRERAALPAAPDVSRVPAVVDRLPLRLSWPGAAPAAAWRAQVFARGDFDRLLLDARVTEPAAVWADPKALPDGDYTLRLRAVDARGLEGLASDLPFALRARPEPPFIQAPAVSAVIYTDSVDLKWTRNAAAPRVRLQIARDPAFTDLVLQPPPLDAAGFAASLPVGEYHWRLASVLTEGDRDRAGPFGDAQRFERRAPPPSPPPAEIKPEGGQLVLRWRAAPEAARYDLQWTAGADFDAKDVQNLSTDKPEVALPQPGPGRYLLRARSVNAAGVAGPWGEPQVYEQPYPRWLWLLPLLLLGLH